MMPRTASDCYEEGMRRATDGTKWKIHSKEFGAEVDTWTSE
jgi:hypothetical protein